MVEEITSSEQLSNILESNKNVIVDFYATWCGPCKVMSPFIEQLSEEHGSVCKFGKIDVDANSELAQKYEITSMPTFIIFENADVQSRVIGANKAALRTSVASMDA